MEKIQIAPMLLFTFAENCFKHSGIKEVETHYITMKIAVIENKFDFYAENSKPVTGACVKREGIGLKNVRKRLELLYAGKYSLEISNLEAKFIVRLSIDNT